MERRVLILLFAVVVMMFISVYQYSWSLFADAFSMVFGWDAATVGLAFTIFTYTATFIQPLSGFLADNYGARKVSMFASVVCGFGLIFSSMVGSPMLLYLAYGFGGFGVGILYGVSTALAVKWFPEKRGFATGIVVFGFGSGAALFNLIIQWLLSIYGLSFALKILGLGMLLVTLIASLFYVYPEGRVERSRSSSSFDFNMKGMVSTWQWYLIYVSFTFTVAIVLIFAAQLKFLAKFFGISGYYLNLALTLFPVGNGLSRILAGFISDRIGRVKCMFIFYLLLGVSTMALVFLGFNPFLFVCLSFVVALFGGSPFAF
ncbi:MAG: MFS transporter, partial [archaeon YNP-LCB-003-016]|uniref:MFS transporter n=1 Tax=Candidatus Culexarchaeum yellowstonense TaxID=2928963 RepID=UPI0026EC56E0